MAMTNQSSEGSSLVHQQMFKVEMNEGPLSKLLVANLMSLFFTCINSIMFHTLLSKPVFRELPRYILFAHMLCNDSVQLMVSMLLYILSFTVQLFPKAVCALISLVGVATFCNAALNLAVMSLERYVAICFPLRHSEMVTRKTAGISIVFIWHFSLINISIDIIYGLTVNPASFKDPMFCTRESFLLSPWQIDLFQGFNILSFVTVTAILIFTYINVVVAARSASAEKESAKKAHKTILLHFVQLVLCVNTFVYGTIERALAGASSSRLFKDLRYLNFLFVLILPRCLSPLIYGLRDDAVRPLFLYYFRCRVQKVKPSVTAHI
ncbi:odorant receptor 131-2-like [Alosa sapidissima]|uniref:odorant receptor 131-2-like n=1 Tax=Alosa sapidissima TaxID=34773 RepID=UPI001C0A4A31|nr:odorant receptor 131-2-like [Alosa sapidissima]